MSARTCRLLFVYLVFVAVILACVWAVWPTRSPITLENFARIHKGMGFAEVQSVFGVPPGDYCTRPIMLLNADSTVPSATQQRSAEVEGIKIVGRGVTDNLGPMKAGRRWWVSDYGACAITFDSEGNVGDKEFIGVYPVPGEPLLDAVRRFLGL